MYFVYMDLMRMESRMTCAIRLVQIRVLNDEEAKDADPTESETDDVFLRKIEATLLTQVFLLVSYCLLRGEGFCMSGSYIPMRQVCPSNWGILG